MRPLANIAAEIAQIEAVKARTPIQSVNADGVSVVNPLWSDLSAQLDKLYEQQRMATLAGQTGSNGQAANGRWERGRVTGIGAI